MARKYIPYHTDKFGYSKPNVDFKLGYIEDLKETGVEDESCDLIMYVKQAYLTYILGEKPSG